MKVVKGEEIIIAVENKVGRLEEITGIISKEGINIRAIVAYVENKQAIFRIITSDNLKTKEILLQKGLKPEAKEVVIVELPDKIGELYKMAGKFKEANIDLEYIYGTTTTAEVATLIFSSNNNEKAIEILANL